jgi:hypothetical protein
MEPNEALEESVNQLLAYLETNYQDLIKDTRTGDNALFRFIFLTNMIDTTNNAPPIDGVLKEALLLCLYTMRSEVAVEAEFMKITNGL